MLLNALVETGAVQKMPEQINGQPAQGQADAQADQEDDRHLPRAGLTLKVSQGKSRSLRFSVLTGGTWTRQPGRLLHGAPTGASGRRWRRDNRSGP